MDIHFENAIYKATLLPDLIWTEDGLYKGLMLQIHNKKNDIVGCLGVYFAPITITVWGNAIGKEIAAGFIQNIILTILPRIKIPINIGKASSLYPRCISIFIGTRETGYVEKENTLYIHSGDTPQEFINQIVFSDEVTDEKIQRVVLDITFQQWQGKTMIPPTEIDICKALFLDFHALHRNVDFLIQENYLDYQKIHKGDVLTLRLTITNEGIKYVQRNYKAIEQAQYVINIMGNVAGRDINKINNSGDSATNIINTGTLALDDAFNELKKAIDKEYAGNDKATVLQEVDTLNKEAKENPDKESVIKKILGFSQKLALLHDSLNVITSKIIPFLQEAVKHLPHP
jgi:hypothetical protein